MSDAVTYVSTRGTAPQLGFDDVLLSGLARDGGLYVPDVWPRLGDEVWDLPADTPYATLAAEVLWPFVAGGCVARADLDRMCDEAYAAFRHPDVVPLVPLDEPSAGDAGTWLLELFHGPTLAFKDVALQLVGRLFDHVLASRGERLTIVGATSGDTGSAAIEACRDREALDIVILHPAGRVSEVQRRQMTTVDAPNVHNVAVDGSFDDCQDLVKAMFNDIGFRDRLRLSAVNSINWARIVPQVVYYVAAVRALGNREQPVAFAVPTGNFGNVFAAYAASRMGAPVDQLVIGSNSNDILFRFLKRGDMEMRDVVPTTSPSMDIQVSSNFERLLFELDERNGNLVAAQISQFRATGTMSLHATAMNELRSLFDGARFDDGEVAACMKQVHEDTGMLLDPHTAIGVAAARAARLNEDVPMVVAATAHPAKFPDAVEAATGVRPALPAHLADLLDRPERGTALPNDLAAVQAFVAEVSRVV
jgi:threonine synthase